MVFLQNYVSGWGYAYTASWSLAIEEHFYFALAIITSYWINKRKFNLKEQSGFKIERTILVVMLICLLMRFVHFYLVHQFHFQMNTVTMTHLRIDSLLAGVLVSYWYHFRLEALRSIFDKTKYLFLPAILLLISFTPFLDLSTSLFERTIGFTMLYMAFGLLLLYFILSENITKKLNSVFTKYAVNAISEIGIYSYSIYIIHTFVISQVAKINIANKYILFTLVFVSCVVSGKVMTDLIEKYFLKMRDKYYPNRVI